DADALADLRSAATGERFVEQVLVDALAFLAAPLLRPGDAQPPSVADLRHELAALRRVDDLRHVLAGDVEDVGVVVLVEEALHLRSELELLRREVEVHAITPFAASSSSSAASSPSSSCKTERVCSPTHGTRVSGPSATLDNFTGLPGTSTGWSPPSTLSISTIMLRRSRCASAMTSDEWKHGPAATPAAVSS